MNLAWVAALLNPADVSPHPNFIGRENLSPPSLLALLIQARFADFRRYLNPDQFGVAEHIPRPSPKLQGSPEMLVVLSAEASLAAETTELGANRLAEFASSTELEDGCRAAAGVLAAVVLAELERHDDAITVLDRLLGSLSHDEADYWLVKALVCQQMWLRKREIGILEDDWARNAVTLLKRIRPSDLSTFPLSKGVKWRSVTSVQQIIEELTRTAMAQQDMGETYERYMDTQLTLIRRGTPQLTLQTYRRAFGGYVPRLNNEFKEYVESKEITFASEDPIDPPLYSALLHYELIGDHGQCRFWRSQLAKLRVVRTEDQLDAVWARADSLRLFRYAEDVKSLDSTLSATRASGPLEAMARDAKRVLKHRCQPGRLRSVDLAVLEAGAHLLSPEDALRALEAVFGVFSATGNWGSLTNATWQAPAVKQERAWRAAIALAGPAGQLDRVAMALSAAIGEFESDSLLERSMVTLIANLEWEGVSDGPREIWRNLLSTGQSSMIHELRDVIGPEVGLAFPNLGRERISGLNDVAVLLNSSFRGEEIPNPLIKQAESLLQDEMAKVRDAASAGSFSLGGLSVADLAVGVAASFQIGSLWKPIAGFLLDPQVHRNDKTAAFIRLATSEELPDDFLEKFRRVEGRLLTGAKADPFLQRRIDPYPAALLFLVAHGLRSETRMLGDLAILSSSSEPEARVEAARILGALAAAGKAPAWAVTLAVLLSSDRGALVRAEAGRTLAMLMPVASRHNDLLIERIIILLKEDGLLVPLLVLRGLLKASIRGRWALPDQLVHEVSAIAISHTARGVRLQADAVLRHGPHAKVSTRADDGASRNL